MTWGDLPVGQDLKKSVEAALLEISRRFFGYHLVKLGNLSSEVSLDQCPIKHSVTVLERYPNQQSDVQIKSTLVASAHSLPFAESSVDAFLLAHELDFAHDPHQILREVDRSLIPNGHVVIVGFNPFSLAGLMRFVPFQSNRLLKDARFFSSMRINDWLHLLGYETLEQHHVVFSSLLFDRKFKRLDKIEAFCRKYMPIFSSIYIIVAKKRVVPLSLIKPKWKPSPKFSAVNASMRNS